MCCPVPPLYLRGISKYPMVPGHEGIGIVSQVGAEVKSLKVRHTDVMHQELMGQHDETTTSASPILIRHRYADCRQGGSRLDS
jgi:NADPH:quinone reductase-like Zn-dependent oxidoreductase